MGVPPPSGIAVCLQGIPDELAVVVVALAEFPLGGLVLDPLDPPTPVNVSMPTTN
jgi:hypothetical protein